MIALIEAFKDCAHLAGQKAPPQQALRDLVSLLTKDTNEVHCLVIQSRLP